MIRSILLLSLLVGALSQSGSIQILPSNPLLYASSHYIVNYYPFLNMPSNTTFSLNFASTYITVPTGSLNVSATVNGNNITGATGSCTSSTCVLKLNRFVSAQSPITFTIGSFVNPYFLRTQTGTATVTYNSSYVENQGYSIQADQYTPMAITSNSLKQSDYGVGNTGVNYVFNFSVPMSPSNVQLSVTIPSQMSVGSLQTSLVYYGTVMYVSPLVVNNIIVMNFNATSTNSSGIVILNISGLVNPQSIGNSSSFAIQILIPNLPGSFSSCSNCAVAQLTSGLFAQSTVAGNIEAINLYSSNSLISQPNNITIYTKLYASIPTGGMFQILLPSNVKPVLPVYCFNSYGFTLTTSTPSCAYNSTNNAIYTNNFVFSGSGSVVITVAIVNPPDTSVANFEFQSFDATSNMIGNSSLAYPIQAVPLVLTASAAKTNYQVETSYNLTVNATLGVALTSSNRIQVILPQANYNTASITCSTGVTIPCNTTLDPLTQNLTVTLSPPCTQCTVGSLLSFAINGLTNPSYINSYSQTVIVQSTTPTGIIQTNPLSLTLNPSTLLITNYTRSGSNSVGAAYSLSFSYSISNYINTNGGQLLINFNQYDTFLNPAYSAAQYTYPYSLTITDSQNNQYSNSIVYYTNYNPNSIQQIAINICGGSNCAGSITISGLRKGFNSLAALTQNIQITSQGGDLVSTSTFNIMQYNVAKVTPTLKLNLTNSVTTLNSNYIIDFVSSYIPFQSGLTFSLSSLHTINGGCYMTHNSSIFNGVFSCQVVNSTSISLTYTGDITLMMLDIIDYTLTIINTTNPISIVPLTYSLACQFSSTVNQQFSTTYSILTPFPLSFLYSKSNNTFGQSATLKVTVVSNYPTFNQIRMSVPSGVISVLPSQTSAYQAAMINNAYQITQIYSLTNQTVILNIINPNSTNINGNISFSMYSAGYLSATGTVTILPVVPMYLGMSAVTTSRVVGDVSNLTVTFNRVNSYSSENQFLLNFTSALFDYSAAMYNGAAVVFPITVPIGLTSITITNLKNLLFVPLSTPTNSINSWTVDGSGYVVAVSSYTPTSLLPNTPASGVSCSFTRTNTVINGVGSLSITYTPRFPTSAGIMNINMPTNQASIVSPSCSMLAASNNANNCTVLSSNSTSLFVTYFNQTTTTLSNILNIEPNSNLMSVYIYTSNNELVEFLTAAITPTIQYNQLTVAGNISSTLVASNGQLFLNITSPSPIDVGSRIVINLPTNTFSRVAALVSQDCNYTINGANFTGCQYGLSGYWLTQTNITFLGSSQLPANTTILLTIYTTNAWSVNSFGAQAISLFVSNPSDNYVAQGSISLANIYGGIPSLVSSAINTPILAQTSNLANAGNSITINFTLPVPLAVGCNILLSLPKSAYTLSSSSLTAITNLQSQSSNTTYYTLSLGVSCSQTTPLCNLANNQYSLTIGLQNNPYVAISTNQLFFQVNLGSNVVSSQSVVNIPAFVAQTLSAASISRSNLNAFAATNVTISVSNPNSVSSYMLIISPFAKPTAILPLILAPTLATSNSQSLAYQLNSSNFFTVNVTAASGTSSSIVIAGQNNLLVSVTPEVYLVTIMDANFIYFTGQITASDILIPYSTGLNLQRIVTTVGLMTNIYLYGTLPASIPSLNVPFNGNNFTVSGSTFNVSLGTIVNSKNVSDSSAYPIAIKNSDFVAYSNSLTISPVLTTQNLTSFTTLTLPTTVNVSSNYNLNININQTSLTYLSVKTPIFFKSMVKCCIDTACTQTFVQSCTFTQQTSNNFVQLWLTSAQPLTNITFVVTALDYQSSFTNQSISIVSALPTSSITVLASLNIAAVNITSTLALQNWKVNTANTYTLNVQPIAKPGYLSIALPSFISSQIGSSSVGVTLTVNGTATASNLVSQGGQSVLVLPVTVSTTNVSLLLTSVVNPVDNTPYSIVIQQAADSAFTNIFGYSNLNIAMNQFDSITLISAVRVVTKVNSPTDLIMEITAPYNNSQFILVFPASQLLTSSTCTIMVNETQALPCQVVNSTAILTSSLSGTNRYTITGLQNQKFYDSTTTGDLITAQIGTPYLRAVTVPSTSTPISPQLTLGSIVMTSFTSSNPTLLSPTTLTYKITIQNTNNINGFILQYAKYYYFFAPTTSCAINGVQISCSPVDNQTLFIPYANASTSNLVVVVSNVYNFVKPANWTMKSVQTHVNNGITTYSDVDLYYNDGTALTALKASAMKMRVILPYNYVQSSPVSFTTIIDSEYSSFLPLSSFALNFTTQKYACQLLASNFVSTLTVSCTFSTSASYNMQVQLYHTQFPAIPLSVGTSNLFIYPSPTSTCSNQMCDSCSVANGQEYCFSCREGLYSSNGECSSTCSSGSFPYSNTNICQPCSPTCSSCFGLYSSNCLSCSDSSLTLSSGSCVSNCPTGNFAYNNFCVDNEQCSAVSGCRLCSTSGFCYQCLPDYTGTPTCKYSNVMPATIMIYIAAPFALVALVSIIIAAAKCVGAESLLSHAIFSFSFLQLFAWTLTIPIMGNVMTAMVLVSFLTLRVIISIVSYEVYYKKNLGELSQKLLQEQSQKEIEGSEKKGGEEKSDLDNWKTKLVRFIAHFNGPDSYELLRSKVAEPVLAVNHSLAIQAIFMANRWLVLFLMFYMLSVATIGDSIFMPLLNISVGGVLSLCRLLTWQKARRCLTCFRG